MAKVKKQQKIKTEDKVKVERAPSKTELYNINLSREFPTFAQELTKIEEKKNPNDLSLGEINNISNKVNYCQ